MGWIVRLARPLRRRTVLSSLLFQPHPHRHWLWCTVCRSKLSRPGADRDPAAAARRESVCLLLPAFLNSRALSQMAFFGFIRSLGQVFGITIGSTILQNQLAKKLPQDFAAQFGGRGDAAFAAIPLIKDLWVDQPPSQKLAR